MLVQAMRRRLAQAMRPVVPAPSLPYQVHLAPMGAQLPRPPLQVRRSWLSDGHPRQNVAFPPSPPTPELPEGYMGRVKQLSNDIKQVEADFKALFHSAVLLFGLILTTLPMIPGMTGDSEGDTSRVQADCDEAVDESKIMEARLSALEAAVTERNAKRVSKPTSGQSA